MDPSNKSKLKSFIDAKTSKPMSYTDIRKSGGDDPQLDHMDTWDAKQTSGSNNPGSNRFKTAVKNFLDPTKNIKGNPKKTRKSGNEIDSSPDSHVIGHENHRSGTQTKKTNIFGTKVTRTKYDDGESAVFKERKSGKKILKTKNQKVNIADDSRKGYMLAKSKVVDKSKSTPTIGWAGNETGSTTERVYKTKSKYKKGSVERTKKSDKSKEIITTQKMNVPNITTQGKVGTGVATVRYKVDEKSKSKWAKGGWQRRSASSGDKAKGNIKVQKSKMHTSYDSWNQGQQNEAIAAASKTKKYK